MPGPTTRQHTCHSPKRAGRETSACRNCGAPLSTGCVELCLAQAATREVRAVFADDATPPGSNTRRQMVWGLHILALKLETDPYL
jgi:hypothetical protein